MDTIFPKVCIECKKFTGLGDFDYICKKCFGEIKLKSSLECIGCKRQTNLGLTCVFCKKENFIDQLIIATDLENTVVEKLMKAHKYKFIYDISKPLSVIARKCAKKLLSKGFNLFEGNPLITAVPLHKLRFNKRGFNQSQLIAVEISNAFHMSYAPDILARTYNSKNQADIKIKEDRLSNVKNNFIFNGNHMVKDKAVILVDDICTTGATLNECARVLKENGTSKVIGLVIARGSFNKISNF